jgi:hypothetical protein
MSNRHGSGSNNGTRKVAATNSSQPAEDTKILAEVAHLSSTISGHVSNFYDLSRHNEMTARNFDLLPLEVALNRCIAYQIISYIEKHRDKGKASLLSRQLPQISPNNVGVGLTEEERLLQYSDLLRDLYPYLRHDKKKDAEEHLFTVFNHGTKITALLSSQGEKWSFGDWDQVSRANTEEQQSDAMVFPPLLNGRTVMRKGETINGEIEPSSGTKAPDIFDQVAPREQREHHSTSKPKTLKKKVGQLLFGGGSGSGGGGGPSSAMETGSYVSTAAAAAAVPDAQQVRTKCPGECGLPFPKLKLFHQNSKTQNTNRLGGPAATRPPEPSLKHGTGETSGTTPSQTKNGGVTETSASGSSFEPVTLRTDAGKPSGRGFQLTDEPEPRSEALLILRLCIRLLITLHNNLVDRQNAQRNRAEQSAATSHLHTDRADQIVAGSETRVGETKGTKEAEGKTR